MTMPDEHKNMTIEGEITDVFAHRIVVHTKEGNVLADLGPKGAEAIAPKAGDKVKLSGEKKPSELKVVTFERGGKVTEIGAGRDEDHGHDHADPAAAKAAVEKLGHTVMAEPHRKPKHFEILGKDADGRHHEHHVDFDGQIKKSTEGDASHDKWKTKPSKTA